jgi:hypothetical protein
VLVLLLLLLLLWFWWWAWSWSWFLVVGGCLVLLVCYLLLVACCLLLLLLADFSFGNTQGNYPTDKSSWAVLFLLVGVILWGLVLYFLESNQLKMMAAIF